MKLTSDSLCLRIFFISTVLLCAYSTSANASAKYSKRRSAEKIRLMATQIKNVYDLLLEASTEAAKLNQTLDDRAAMEDQLNNYLVRINLDQMNTLQEALAANKIGITGHLSKINTQLKFANFPQYIGQWTNINYVAVLGPDTYVIIDTARLNSLKSFEYAQKVFEGAISVRPPLDRNKIFESYLVDAEKSLEAAFEKISEVDAVYNKKLNTLDGVQPWSQPE